MATRVQRRRGTTAQNRVFTGAAGEVTVDTDRNELRVHDGSTAGGSMLYQTADLFARDLGDLPAPASGEILLPPGKVLFKGTVNIGANALRLSEGTVLLGDAAATIVSSATGGVLRADGLEAPVIGREFSIVATAGPCLALNGLIDHQLNLFFVGLFGASAGTINGFDVQAIKACFINAADGLTFGGTTNKLFVHESPFYGITGSAIRLAADFNATVVDIVTSFFKFDSPGIGVEAVAGYTVGDGLLRGSLIDGTAVPLSGLSPADVNWKMTDNTGVRDSRVGGGLYLTASAETVIAATDTPVKVAGTTAAYALNERFATVGNNRLVHTGRAPALVQADATFSIDAASNNQVLWIYLAKNGVVLPESGVRARVAGGGDERSGAVNALVEMVEDDYLEVWTANETSTANVEFLALNLTARA